MNIQIPLPPDLVPVLLSGLFLVPVLIGIVERFKANEAWRPWTFAFAMLLGIFAGVAYVCLRYEVISWAYVGIGAAFGLVLGLAAAGLYDVGKAFTRPSTVSVTSPETVTMSETGAVTITPEAQATTTIAPEEG